MKNTRDDYPVSMKLNGAASLFLSETAPFSIVLGKIITRFP